MTLARINFFDRLEFAIWMTLPFLCQPFSSSEFMHALFLVNIFEIRCTFA